MDESSSEKEIVPVSKFLFCKSYTISRDGSNLKYWDAETARKYHESQRPQLFECIYTSEDDNPYVKPFFDIERRLCRIDDSGSTTNKEYVKSMPITEKEEEDFKQEIIERISKQFSSIPSFDIKKCIWAYRHGFDGKGKLQIPKQKLSFRVFVNGYKLRRETMRDWIKSYNRDVAENLLDLSVYSKKRVLGCVNFWKDDRLLHAVDEQVPWEQYLVLNVSNTDEEILFSIPETDCQKNRQNRSLNKKELKKLEDCQNISESANDELTEEVTTLLDMMSFERIDNEETWKQIGWALHNLSPSYLGLWIKCSEMSPKFVNGECDKLWNKMKPNKFTIASLYLWAKEDNPDKLQEFRARFSIKKAALNAEEDSVIADAIFNRYKSRFAYSGGKWYEMNPYWKVVNFEGGKTNSILHNLIVRDFSPMCASKGKAIIDDLYARKILPDTNPNDFTVEDSRLYQLGQGYHALAYNSKKMKFLRDIWYHLTNFFTIPDLVQKFDKDRYLRGFPNGVLDLRSEPFVFRNFRPDDYISKVCAFDYVDYDDIEIQNDILSILHAPFQYDEKYEFTMDTIADSFGGNFPRQRFHNWTGRGAGLGNGGNGKSGYKNITSNSFGDLAGILPTVILTKEASSGSAHQAGLPDLDGVLIAFTNEPDGAWQGAMIKQLTGGETIKVRDCGEKAVSFRPTFVIIALCNILPEILDTTGGAYRRYVITKFDYKFVQNPILPFEKLAISEQAIDDKFKQEKYCQQFIRMLLKRFTRVNNDPFLSPPKRIQEDSKKYIDDNNHLKEFLTENLTFTPNEKTNTVRLLDVWTLLRIWWKDNHDEKMKTKKKELKSALEDVCGDSVSHENIFHGAKMNDHASSSCEVEDILG